MFILVSQILDIICPQWQMRLLGIGSDGASSMTGHLRGVVTRIASESSNKIYRVWCGLHQLDLVMKHAYEALWDNEVVDIMKKFIAHLRQQSGLITSMRCTCPQLSTRWLVMGKVSEWLLAKRIPLFDYLQSARDPVSTAPPDWWWIVIAGISALTEIINPVFVKLQAKNLLVSTQTAMLEGLATDICIAVGIDGPFSPEEIAGLDMEFNCVCGRWSVSYAHVLSFLEGLGMYSRHTLQVLTDDLHCKVISSIGDLATGMVNGIIEIQVERNNRNEAADDLPPVLPHEIIKMSTAEYGNKIVDRHLQQLKLLWTDEDIGEIENQHRQLRNAYRNEPALKSALDAYARTTTTTSSFESGWEILTGRFEILRDFCGGIATVFANTASVESDFSILGWEKDVYRLSITDLSLEGIMQCKQYELLSSLV
jgi:hypothetical protein